MKEVEVNQEVRTIAKTVKPRVTIDEKDGKWSLKSEKTYKTTTVEFTPGIEFEEVSPDGKQITVFNHLIHILEFLFLDDYSI